MTCGREGPTGTQPDSQSPVLHPAQSCLPDCREWPSAPTPSSFLHSAVHPSPVQQVFAKHGPGPRAATVNSDITFSMPTGQLSLWQAQEVPAPRLFPSHVPLTAIKFLKFPASYSSFIGILFI